MRAASTFRLVLACAALVTWSPQLERDACA